MNMALKRSAITSTALINLYISDTLYCSASFSSLLTNNYVIQFGLIWNLQWRLLFDNSALVIICKSRHRRSVKKVFFKISQNSQENACARVSFFNKVAGLSTPSPPPPPSPPPLSSINPEPVKPYLWNFAWVWYYISSFKKYQNSNQGHVTFLMTSSYFNTVIEYKCFYE